MSNNLNKKNLPLKIVKKWKNLFLTCRTRITHIKCVSNLLMSATDNVWYFITFNWNSAFIGIVKFNLPRAHI